MNAIQRVAVSAGLSTGAAGVYWGLGLAPLQTGISAALAFAGCSAALLVPLPSFGPKAAPARKSLAKPAAALPSPQVKVLVDLISEAEAQVARLKKAARKLTSDEAVAPVMRIADAASEGLVSLRGRGVVDPLARQVLAYYLPETVKLAETLVTMEGMRSAAPETVATVVATLKRLEKVFFEFADASTSADVAQLQRDLKLLEGTLDRLNEGTR